MPTAEYREHNRHKVLEAAYNCFLEFGIRGTTQKRIAETAHLTPRSVQRYFGSREGMVIEVAALIDERYSDFVQLYRADHVPSDANGLEEMAVFLESQKHLWLQRSTFFLVIKELETYCRRVNLFEKPKPPLPQTVASMQPHLQTIIKLGIADGSMKPDLRADEVSDLIAETYEGIFAHVIVADDDSTSEERIRANDLIDRYIAHVLESLAARA